ncbi:hypothetical protein DL98DRAFT_584927 [Cadophora sp. DSE1049]|nr:hypothetical protein DL98DRAFT_584927 [Cadophora sp. DSE1049]
MAAITSSKEDLILALKALRAWIVGEKRLKTCMDRHNLNHAPVDRGPHQFDLGSLNGPLPEMTDVSSVLFDPFFGKLLIKFCRLPTSLQRSISTFALPQGPVIIEVAFTDNELNLGRLSDHSNQLRCNSPFAGVLMACGQLKYKAFNILPVHLTKKAKSFRAAEQSEIVYIGQRTYCMWRTSRH